MNTHEQKLNWSELKSQLKKKFAALTDDDMQYTDAKREEMLGNIQIKLGKTKEEWQAIIAAL